MKPVIERLKTDVKVLTGESQTFYDDLAKLIKGYETLVEDKKRLVNTLSRIAIEFQNLHPDTDKCDSVGEIYHLLREAGAIIE